MVKFLQSTPCEVLIRLTVIYYPARLVFHLVRKWIFWPDWRINLHNYILSSELLDLQFCKLSHSFSWGPPRLQWRGDICTQATNTTTFCTFHCLNKFCKFYNFCNFFSFHKNCNFLLPLLFIYLQIFSIFCKFSNFLQLRGSLGIC